MLPFILWVGGRSNGGNSPAISVRKGFLFSSVGFFGPPEHAKILRRGAVAHLRETVGAAGTPNREDLIERAVAAIGDENGSQAADILDSVSTWVSPSIMFPPFFISCANAW